jgi:two-component system, OmpR family, sensor histidine kinase KdpD
MNNLVHLRRIVSVQWTGYAVTLAAVALLNEAVGFFVRDVNVSLLSIVNLTVVVAAARAFGSGPAILASVTGYFIFDWFYVPPLYSLGGASPEGWLELILFLSTAIITGQLTAEARRRAHQAEQREREIAVLYDVVRLVSDTDLDRALSAVAERLRRELSVTAVAITVAEKMDLPTTAVAGDPRAFSEFVTLASQRGESLEEGTVPLSSVSGGVPGSSRIVLPTEPREPGQTTQQTEALEIPLESHSRREGILLIIDSAGSLEFDSAHNRLLSAAAAQLALAVERRRLRQEATESEVLRRADELKSVLLNTVSHDLRTPLASIMASGESLLQKDVEWTEQERDEYAGAIVRETRRLNRLVNNLLDLSRIEAGGLLLDLDWYPLESLVNDVLGRLRPITSLHRVVVEIEKDLPPIRLDYVKIDQVLSNLVENATRYSPAGTELLVSARRDGAEIRVEVSDRGGGIPPEAVNLLFKPFHRLDGPGLWTKGIGLGLAIAKGLVEAHGGRIWAENRAGGGASFVFTLPATHNSGMAAELSEKSS